MFGGKHKGKGTEIRGSTVLQELQMALLCRNHKFKAGNSKRLGKRSEQRQIMDILL